MRWRRLLVLWALGASSAAGLGAGAAAQAPSSSASTARRPGTSGDAASPPANSAAGAQVQARLSADVAGGRPIVVHVIVALCDNEHQGIVPVPRSLGNGRDPASNLYWGALYGVRSFLPRRAGWKVEVTAPPTDPRVLARVALVDRVARAGAAVPVHVVADAWDGAQIRAAIGRFLEMSAGRAAEDVRIGAGGSATIVRAGGGAHIVAFVGHDGLMDFSLPSVAGDPAAAPRSAVVLACASKRYFEPHLRTSGAHPLLLTTGLMAPEAYSLDAALRAWIGGGTSAAAGDAAARAYDRHQHCGARAARNLFWGAP